MTSGASSDVDRGSNAPEQLAELAVELAVAAGRMAVQGRAAGFAVDTKSSATDVVTDVDRQVEQFLIAELDRLRPGDSVLGEEGGQLSQSSTGVRWIVDPIDGTVNFMLGMPVYAVSIAAEVDGVVVAGCVHNPVSDEVFRAWRGGGAYLADERLTGPRAVPLAEAVVATGFGYDPGYRAEQGELVGRLLARIGNLRRLGSAALDLCSLAAGRVDLYFEGPLGDWDFAAGALIAAESGAVLSGLRDRAVSSAMVAGAHRDTAREFFELLTELGADRIADEFLERRADS